MSDSNEKGLQENIHNEPGADDLRYFYADMLDERGDDDRAAFIRVQLGLGNVCDELQGHLTDENREATLERLRQRERELLAKHREEWEEPLRSLYPAIVRIEFHRGFPDHITLPAQAFLDNTESIFAAAPITSVHLTERSAEQVRLLAASPFLSNLTTLNLLYNHIGDAGAIALAASPFLSNLTSFNLLYNQIGHVGAQALARPSKPLLREP